MFVEVCKTSDIPKGEGRVFTVKDIGVAVFNKDGKFHAINNKCPHEGGSLGEGFLDEKIITCPLHAWQFDIGTGKCQNSDCCIEVYKVKLENNKVMVSL